MRPRFAPSACMSGSVHETRLSSADLAMQATTARRWWPVLWPTPCFEALQCSRRAITTYERPNGHLRRSRG
jgi:proteasome lid subunit RPN8/RPN11